MVNQLRKVIHDNFAANNITVTEMVIWLMMIDEISEKLAERKQ